MTEFFNKIKAACQRMSARRETQLIDEKINKLIEKKNELIGNNVVNDKKQRNNDNVVVDVAINVNHAEVKAYMKKHDNVDELVNYMLTNNYDNVLIDVAKDMSIDVVALKYNVTKTTKFFLQRIGKNNVKELNDNEKSYFINHLIVLYATKHKVKQHNVVFKFGTRKAETLKSYAIYRKRCVQDIYV